MDRDRQSDLYASLNRHLKDADITRQLDGRGRVLWLSERLEDYVARLHGFGVARSTAIGALVSSDLARAVDAGVAVLDEHLAAEEAPQGAQRAWRAFKTALNELQRDPNLGNVEALQSAYERFRTELAAAGQEPRLTK